MGRPTAAAEIFGGRNRIVISGVRSPGEADEIRKLGGEVYLVVRSRVPHSPSHAVENELLGYKNFTGTIDNEGGFEDLYRRIDSIVEKMIATKESITLN